VVEVIAFRDAAEFETWLAEHVDVTAGVWLKIAKKVRRRVTDRRRGGRPRVVLRLDLRPAQGLRRSYLQKYVPRRPRSRWSQVNVRKVEELLATGRMRPSGLAEVEAAKADGRWDAAYESQALATVPPDLADALVASPRAARAFESLSKTRRYAVILDLVTTRTPRTRSAHLRKAITALEASAD
jgi:uncharacterized protein YdeI (YjbR/CyaY-like superfamily)